ncbi:MAG: methionyl-tRNA formyltransferase, partial [Actinomyces sp.]
MLCGTPGVAVHTLRTLDTLAAGGGPRLVGVVTRPDTRRGRGGRTSPSPVKAAAVELGIPVHHRLDVLDELDPDLVVVVAYGRLIPAPLLERHPMVNIHFSLLPRWRGAAPVERAILAGD